MVGFMEKDVNNIEQILKDIRGSLRIIIKKQDSLELKLESLLNHDPSIKQRSAEQLEIDLNSINNIFSGHFKGCDFTQNYLKGTVGRFLNLLGFDSVFEAMEIAVSRMKDEVSVKKYFWGICNNRIEKTIEETDEDKNNKPSHPNNLWLKDALDIENVEK